MIGVYALMQFLFAPVVGALSDRFGRRPILFVALAATAIDYVIMALTPWFWLLLVTRAVAGLLAASMTASMAYIADISPPEIRSRRFGLAHASLGLGFIFGPLTGGVLGEVWVAAALPACRRLRCRELHPGPVLPARIPAGPRRAAALGALNPLTPLSRVFLLARFCPSLRSSSSSSWWARATAPCW